MKVHFHTLVFLAFTALALSAAGCVVDNTSHTSCFNPLYMTWSIDDNLGTALRCSDVGSGTVRVTARGVVSDFPCNAFAGQTFDVPGGTYTVDAQLRDYSNTSVISEASMVFSVPTCGGFDIDVPFCVGLACP